MSVASAYAASVASAQSTLVGISPPSPFIGPLVQCSVNQDGTLHLVVATTGAVYDIPAAAALNFANWIVTNFT